MFETEYLWHNLNLKLYYLYYSYYDARIHEFDVHGSVQHNTNLIEMTNNMQLCSTIYYSIVS
jgi:hypothetical protein